MGIIWMNATACVSNICEWVRSVSLVSGGLRDD